MIIKTKKYKGVYGYEFSSRWWKRKNEKRLYTVSKKQGIYYYFLIVNIIDNIYQL